MVYAASGPVSLHDSEMNCTDLSAYCVVVVVLDRSRIEPLDQLVVVAVAAAAVAGVAGVVAAVVLDPCDGAACAFDDFVERSDELATIGYEALTYSYYCNRFDLGSVAICMHLTGHCMIVVDMATIVVAWTPAVRFVVQ